MKVHLGELINLIQNKPVFAGNTVSHSTMKELVKNGLAENTERGYIPTERGFWVFNQLICKTIEIEEVHSFRFLVQNNQ
jgi:hypothetical protein